ncbi:MAG: DUF4097 family beta strand repeat-containing protein [Eubacteriales bacterium]|nr:DUF4097 family beta strand repeat-containing protein [Eubacteriales bacterium]
MKKTGLIILIVVCLVIFFSALTGGVLLTLRTVGWQALLDRTQLQERVDTLLERAEPWGGFPLTITRRAIDETRPLDWDLDQVRLIQITAVSDQVIVSPVDQAGSARLNGVYRGSGKVGLVVVKQDDVLIIRVDYPHFGISFSDLTLQVDLPAGYGGTVKVTTVSGAIDLPAQRGQDWDALDLKSVSGSIRAANTADAGVTFSTVSGQVGLSGLSAPVTGKTTSGQLDLSYDRAAPTTLSTVSGDVTLHLPPSSVFKLDFTTVTGNFSHEGLDLDVTTQGSRKISALSGQGGLAFAVSTTSGSLTLSAN